MVEHEHFNRGFCRFQFQADLFLDGCEQGRRRIGGIAGRRHFNAHAAKLRFIRRPLQQEVVFAVSPV